MIDNDSPTATDRRVLLLSVIFALLASAAPLIFGAGTLRVLGDAFLLLAMAQMWNHLAGYTGLVSIGHQAFVGVGAYVLFIASDQIGVPPYAAIPVAAAASAALALLVAPCLFRLRDAYFSIGMWVLAEILHLLVSRSDTLGGTAGLPLKSIQRLDISHFAVICFYLSAGIALAAVAGLYVLMRSRLGLGLLTVRENDVAAASVGVDVSRNRLIAFAISAFGCGAAGATHYLSSMFVGADSAFDVNWVVAMLFIVVIGGLGTIEGPIVGTILYVGLRELFTNYLGLSGGWYLVATGVVAVAVTLTAPRGIWGWLREWFGLQGFDVRRTPVSRYGNSRDDHAKENRLLS
jgi:branched-chain amino acid transport system permease protein